MADNQKTYAISRIMSSEDGLPGEVTVQVKPKWYDAYSSNERKWTDTPKKYNGTRNYILGMLYTLRALYPNDTIKLHSYVKVSPAEIKRRAKKTVINDILTEVKHLKDAYSLPEARAALGSLAIKLDTMWKEA